MRWEDEQYVRLYTRDTVTWKLLPWQAKAILPLILRKLDKAGVLDVGEDGVEGIAAAIDMPLGLVEAGLPELLRRGTFLLTSTRLVMPNYLPAQTAVMSDKARKQAQRERARSAAMSDGEGGEVTERDEPVTARDVPVTRSHAESRGVTDGHSLLCSSLLSQNPLTPQPAAGAPPAAPAPEALPAAPASPQFPPDVEDVFAHWQRVMASPRSVLDAKLAKVVRAAIDRHGVADCKRAVDGCFASDWHMNRPGGGNERGKKFRKLSLILRDAEHVAEFLELAPEPAAAPAPVADAAAYRPFRPIAAAARAGADQPLLDDSFLHATTLLRGNHG